MDATFDHIYSKWGFFAVPTTFAKTDDAALEKYVKECDALCCWLNDKLCKQKTTWLCGNSLTVPDYQMAHIMWTYWKNDQN